MPPACEPVASGIDVEVRYGTCRRVVTYYAVLHLCTNRQCTGAVVAHYRDGPRGYEYQFHNPEWREHQVGESVPERPRRILQDANDASNAPVACASAAVKAVEAMMAEVGYKDRKLGLRKRIDMAVADGKLPKLMAALAHDVREIGNETHTDDNPEPLTTRSDAQRALKFANLLSEYLFVLPAEIERVQATCSKGTDRNTAPAVGPS